MTKNDTDALSIKHPIGNLSTENNNENDLCIYKAASVFWS